MPQNNGSTAKQSVHKSLANGEQEAPMDCGGRHTYERLSGVLCLCPRHLLRPFLRSGACVQLFGFQQQD
jgi:hypothetical protein